MKIKNKFTGVVSNERADIARAMIRQGMAEALEPDTGDDGVVRAGNETYRLPQPGDYKPPKVEWSVVIVERSVGPKDAVQTWRILAIQRAAIRQHVTGGFVDLQHCMLPPEFVHDKKYHTGERFCSAFGCPVPPEILESYKKQWKANEQLRAPYEGRPAPNRPDAKQDLAQIEKVQIAAGSSGVLQGQELAKRPGSRH